MLREYFSQYLRATSPVGDDSIKHYLRGIKAISAHLSSCGYPIVDLFDITTKIELDEIKDFLFSNAEFLQKNEKGNRMYSVAFNHFYKFACQDAINDKATIEKLDIVIPAPQRVNRSAGQSWKRNQIIVSQVIQSANYSCEYNIQHKTFISNSTKQNYVEGHHIIPIEKQEKFSTSLDIYANIICLCPTCHRLLHYGIKEEKMFVLEKIYNERNVRLIKSGINIGLQDLCQIVI